MLIRSTSLSALAFALVIGAVASVQIKAQGDPVDNYLRSAEEKANRVVSNAGAQGRGIAMEAGQAVLNAVGAFRAAYSDSLQSTEASLDQQRTALFRDIRASADRLDEFTRTGTGNLQQVADTLAASVSNLPFGKDIPRVIRTGPLFVTASSAQTQELVVKGFGLANNNPTLSFGGIILRPNTATDTELRFAMPPLSFSPDAPTAASLVLTLFERQTRLVFFSKYVARTYPVRLTALPQRLASYEITPRQRVAEMLDETKQTPGYRCASPQGEGTNTVPVQVAPTPGWDIDVNSIHYNRSYSNHGSMTMNTTSSSGFTATLTCSGWGRIVGPFGVVIDAGSVGVEQGTFSFRQTRASSTLKNGDKILGALNWGQAVTLNNLPGDMETVVVVLKFFNGETLSVDGSGDSSFATVSLNSSSKILTITPKRVDDALRR